MTPGTALTYGITLQQSFVVIAATFSLFAPFLSSHRVKILIFVTNLNISAQGPPGTFLHVPDGLLRDGQPAPAQRLQSLVVEHPHLQLSDHVFFNQYVHALW